MHPQKHLWSAPCHRTGGDFGETHRRNGRNAFVDSLCVSRVGVQAGIDDRPPTGFDHMSRPITGHVRADGHREQSLRIRMHLQTCQSPDRREEGARLAERRAQRSAEATKQIVNPPHRPHSGQWPVAPMTALLASQRFLSAGPALNLVLPSFQTQASGFT